MEYRITLEKADWEKNMDLRVVTHCAPVLAGIKPSNAFMMPEEDTMKLIYALKDTGVSLRIIHKAAGKNMWLIYRKRALEEYLMSKNHRGFLKDCGYNYFSLTKLFETLSYRYEAFKNGGEFPHELGLMLGYPLCDVKGFILHQGNDFLYSGYWKVYGNLEQTKKMFQAYDLVQYQMIEQVKNGKPLNQIIETYTHYQVPNIA